MQHSAEARARAVGCQKSIHAIYVEMKDEASRKQRRKGSTKNLPKVSYERATREYLRRVSLQQIYC